MEVTAPHECCQTPLPGTISLIMGMVGAPTAAGGGGVRDAALKLAMDKAAKQKKKINIKKRKRRQSMIR